MQIGCTAQLNDLYFLFLIFYFYIFTIYLHTSEHGSCIIDYYSLLLFLQSFWLGWVVGSWPLFWALFISFVLGTAYSINVSCFFNVICYFHAEKMDRAWLKQNMLFFFFGFQIMLFSRNKTYINCSCSWSSITMLRYCSLSRLKEISWWNDLSQTLNYYKLWMMIRWLQLGSGCSMGIALCTLSTMANLFGFFKTSLLH